MYTIKRNTWNGGVYFTIVDNERGIEFGYYYFKDDAAQRIKQLYYGLLSGIPY